MSLASRAREYSRRYLAGHPTREEFRAWQAREIATGAWRNIPLTAKQEARQARLVARTSGAQIPLSFPEIPLDIEPQPG